MNRLHGISYDKTGADTTYTIHDAASVAIEYMTAGDKARVKKVITTGISTEENTYDTEGRVTDYSMTLASRPSYPFVTSYQYDTASRLTEIRYPEQYGMAGSPRKIVTPSYDDASRLTELKVDNQIQLNELAYNPMGQVTSLKTAAATGNSHVEQYTYENETGLLTNQKVIRQNTGTTLLDLSYGYNRGNSVGNTTSGKTGQLTHVINNLDRNKDRVYEHDALGRLIKAKGGAASGAPGVTANWIQEYSYDRYGNKTATLSNGVTWDGQSTAPVPTDGLPSLSYNTANNRINSAGWEFDLDGNQTRGQNQNGLWLRFEYDAAGRLVKTKDDAGNVLETFTYGASRNRLVNETAAGRTYYAWGGAAVIAEYFETSTTPGWTKTYIHAGSRLLSTFTKSGGSEVEEFHHPDRLGTKLVTNPSAVTTYQQSTLPFGTALNAESTAYSNQVFTSYDRGASSGLDYAVNRTYSQGQSRFTQVDPIGLGAATLYNPQSNNLYAYVTNKPADFVDPTGLYAACVHLAMSQFLGREAKQPGGFVDKIAHFTGDGLKAADSDEYAAPHPLNFGQAATTQTGPTMYPHFASRPKIEEEKAKFWRYTTQGGYAGNQAAGFVLHAIQDSAAHQGFNPPEGHAWATKIEGNDPDIVIGDQKFIGAANEEFGLWKKDSSAMLTNGQITRLLRAIQAACGKTPLKITWPPRGTPQGGGGRIGGSGYGGSGGSGSSSGGNDRQFDWLWRWYEQQRRYEGNYPIIG